MRAGEMEGPQTKHNAAMKNVHYMTCVLIIVLALPNVSAIYSLAISSPACIGPFVLERLIVVKQSKETGQGCSTAVRGDSCHR